MTSASEGLLETFDSNASSHGFLANASDVVHKAIAAINDAALVHNTWSVAEGVGVFLSSSSAAQSFFGVDLMVLVLAVPLLSAVLALACVLVPSGPAPTLTLRWMHALARFANLEVFLLAFLLYMAEQESLVRVDTLSGFACLVAYVPCLVVSLLFTTQAVRRAEARELAGEGKQG